MPAGMEGFGNDSEPRDTSSDEWPFATGSVVGYRWWTYEVHKGYCPRRQDALSNCLCGICHPVLSGSFDTEWQGSRLDAVCKGTGITWTPHWTQQIVNMKCKRVLDYPSTCGCGIWAYWRLPHSAKSVSGYSYPVGGRIEGSGRVVIGERGFRCERARITHLAVYPGTPASVVKSLEERFEVPVLMSVKARLPGNPVSAALARKTKADPQYGPAPMSARKVVRIITGF